MTLGDGLAAAASAQDPKVEALLNALWQLLDDMQGGLSVCAAAKAQARIAINPFLCAEDICKGWMTLAEAEQIERECNP